MFIPIAAQVASYPADNRTNYVEKHCDGFRLKDKVGGNLTAFAVFLLFIYLFWLFARRAAFFSFEIISKKNSTPVGCGCICSFESKFSVSSRTGSLLFAAAVGMCICWRVCKGARLLKLPLFDLLPELGNRAAAETGHGTAVHTVGGSLGSS